MKKIFVSFLLFCNSIVLFSQSPQVDWVEHYGTGNDEFSWKIIKDFQNNYFTVTGFRGGTNFAGQNFTHLSESHIWDFVVSKFDASNVLQWQKHIYCTADPALPGVANMSFPDCKIDGSGNIYVYIEYDGILHVENSNIASGSTQQFQTNAQSVTKINNSGNIDWMKNLITGSSLAVSNKDVFDLNSSGEILLHVWCYDGNQDVVVNGNVIPISSNFGNMLFAKFSSTGQYMWHTLMPEGNWNNSKIKFDNNTNQDAFITGANPGQLTLNNSNNIVLSATSGSGAFVARSQAISFASVFWAKRIIGSGSTQVQQILTDNFGNFVALGVSDANLDFGDSITLEGSTKYAFIVKYKSDGTTVLANSLVFGNVYLRYSSFDMLGNFYLCGSFTDSITFNNNSKLLAEAANTNTGFLAKFSASGEFQWAIKVNGLFSTEITSAQAVGDNEIYISGIIKGTSIFENNTIQCYGELDPFYSKLSGCAAPAVEINSSGPTTLCNGQSVTLSTPVQTGATYAWIKDNTIISGQTNNSLVVSQPGNYSVIVSLGGACVDTSEVISVQQSSTIFTITTIPANITGICPGNQLTLTTSIPFASFNWSNGNQSNLNAITQAGNYQVTVTDFSGCTGTASITISAFTPPPVPDIQVNSGTDCILACISTIQPIKYKWRKNGDVVGNNSQFLDITTLGNGFYTVEITDANGCISITSPCSISNCMDCTVGIQEAESEKSKLKIYPNPSSGQIVCEVFEQGYFRLKVFNIVGEIVYLHEKVSGKSEHNLSFLPNGIYFLQLETEEGGTLKEKVLIQNK